MHEDDYEDEDWDDEDEDYEDEVIVATQPEQPNPSSYMKAGIMRRVGSTRSGYANEKVWMLSDNVQAIFEADDRGEAVFAANIEALLEALEDRFPAPPGFTFFLRDTYRRAAISQYEHPVARMGTSWEEILTIVKEDDTQDFFLVPTQMGLPPGTYATYPTGQVAREQGITAKYGIDDEVYATQSCKFGGYYYQVYHSPKDAKQLQKNRKQAETRAAKTGTETVEVNAGGVATRRALPYSRCNFPMWQLKELHNAFSRAAIGDYENCHIKTTIKIGGPRNSDGHSALTKSQLTKYRRTQLVKNITKLRKLCIRFKRNWRHKFDTPDGNYDVGIAPMLAQFFPYIKALLKSSNEDFVAFGKWLRIEKGQATKWAREREAALDTEKTEVEKAKEAEKAEEEEEELPIGVRRKPKASEPPPTPQPRTVAAAPKIPEQLQK
jgi:hypothetical protein